MFSGLMSRWKMPFLAPRAHEHVNRGHAHVRANSTGAQFRVHAKECSRPGGGPALLSATRLCR